VRLGEALRARALALGFARAGVARAGPLGEEGERLRAWLAAGRHGEMSWMAETAAVRADPRHEGMLPEARSVVVVVAPYARADAGERIGPAPGRVARYARGRDYHNVLHKKLRKLTSLLREHGHAARASVDSLPVMERAWAQRAGVGFIGKNCCLIVPGLGSHVFLAAIVTSAELPADAPMAERCGSCRACLDACPTSAFAGARELDARRCISYLTIEQPGAIPEALRASVGDWIFGCDVCQDVCPFNRTSPAPPEATTAFAPDPRWSAADAAAVLAMDDRAFAAWAHGSPVQRPGRAGMARNAAVVLGNRGGRVHLPVLRRAAAEDPSEVVREAAAWAIARLTGTSGD
jgi:epoxyqueuosine reductase